MEIFNREIKSGDFVKVRVGGNGHLSGGYLEGVVKDEEESHKMLRLESGWCVHAHDELLTHKPKSD